MIARLLLCFALCLGVPAAAQRIDTAEAVQAALDAAWPQLRAHPRLLASDDRLRAACARPGKA